MLYNIIMVILIAFTAIFSFFAGYWVFAAGFRTGKSGENPTKPAPKKRKKVAKTPPEIEKMNRVLSNIEKYDGTSAGQEDVK